MSIAHQERVVKGFKKKKRLSETREGKRGREREIGMEREEKEDNGILVLGFLFPPALSLSFRPDTLPLPL